MRVLANGFALRHRRDHGRAEVLGVRAREADALDAVDGVASPQELAELGAEVRGKIAAPRVHVLAEQCDLAHALSGEARHLRDDLARTTRHLASANRGDDAVGALRVAAHRDLHPRLEPALTVHRKLAGEHTVLDSEAATRDAEPTCAEPLPEVRDRARAER